MLAFGPGFFENGCGKRRLVPKMFLVKTHVFGKSLLKSLWEAVLWENVGAKMLIGCVRNFLVLRICYKVDMGHVLSGFHVLSNLLFWSNTGFL